MTRMTLKRCVLLFSKAMHTKLNSKRLEGWTGWNVPGWEEECKERLAAHAITAKTKEDWVDVANFAMFMWNLTKE